MAVRIKFSNAKRQFDHLKDNRANLHKDHQVKLALEMNALWRGEKVALVGIKFFTLPSAGQEMHFPIYSRHLPKPIRDYWRRHLCPNSHPEHGHLKSYYPKVTQPPQWKRYLYGTGNWKGKLTLCKYPERIALPMGWRLRIKADIDANLSTSYIVRIKLRCEQMVSKWNNATSSLTFVHPETGNALSPEITITNWDAEDYGSLIWDSQPLRSEVNQWTIKLKWEIWYYPQGQPNQKRYVFEMNTHVIYATLGEPLSCGTEDYQNPWYTILDRATEWAAGKTSAVDAMEAITRRVYDLPLFDYPETDADWASRLCRFSRWSTHNIELDNDKEGIGNNEVGDNNLYPLLPNSNDLSSRYAPIPDAKAQCTDAASILIVLFRAMGINAITLLIDDPGGPDWFGTKDIDPIGAPGWRSTVWNYHHLGDLNTASPAGPLYDACLTLDAGGHTPRYVVGMDWSTYRSMLWDGSGIFYIHGRYIPGIEKPYYHEKYRQGSEPF